jgi:predicted RNA-binding protein with PIN domain
MALRIIIDGYNLIRQSPALRSYDSQDIAQGREKLIEMLVSYRTLKHHPILVVFDGWQDGAVTEHRTRDKGIDVIFSKRGEKADEVIKRLVSRLSEELIVVTSDREIINFCQNRRCEVIPSPAFEEKMECAFLFSIKGVAEEDEKPLSPLSTKKKGPSKKLPKAKRKLEQRLKKL